MIYLDSTLFVNAAIDAGEKGKLASECIAVINKNKTKQCMTSLLTFDEVTYATRKFKGHDIGIEAGEAFLSTHLFFSEVTLAIIGEALSVIKHAQLLPRDAIHLATMKMYGVHEIVSEDSDFDRIKEIKRLTLQNFMKRLHA